MLLENHPDKDFDMRYFNSDGGEATLCGNGGRCIVSFAHQLGIIGQSTDFNAVDGIHHAEIQSLNGVHYVDLQMNDLDLSGLNSDFDYLNTGSPHHILWVDDVSNIDVYSKGKMLRYADRFAAIGGVNVNFIEPISTHKLRIRTYERGVENETLACGTGSTAAAILYAVKTGLKSGSILLEALGGDLIVRFEIDGHFAKNIFLSGPAQAVFNGIIEV
jgi:diaminopimelate epimerase